MDFVRFDKEIPLNREYEVIVIGGGPAGCAAAAASARHGAKTLLIESSCSLGGMGTIGLLPAWCPFSDEEKIIYRSIAQEVFENTKAQMPHIAPDATHWVPIDTEVLKRVYDELVSASGADVLFDTTVCAAKTENGAVQYVTVANQAGLTAYEAKVYIDCTGDADLVVQSGGECDYGDENGEVQPSSICFVMTNVDEYWYRHGLPLHDWNLPESPIYKMLGNPKYPLINDYHACLHLVAPRTVGFNAAHIWDVDARDPMSVSRSMMVGRQQAHQYAQALQEFMPQAFGASHLAATGQVMGIRESRRIRGDYTLVLDDYLARRTFPDEIARSCYFVDIHNTKAQRDQMQEDVEKGDISEEKVLERDLRYKKGESHGIPYRCLLPKGLTNVLVAGKTISADHVMQACIRVMPVCLVTGQAAGTAAFMAARGDVSPRELNVQALRKTLRDDGAWFE
ncbi:MAG: FAD-dependent oxidoreductase [Clostridiales bacterium]|nr:FAD-dependent oxidoreductase [Clostridiales bacterium]